MGLVRARAGTGAGRVHVRGKRGGKERKSAERKKGKVERNSCLLFCAFTSPKAERTSTSPPSPLQPRVTRTRTAVPRPVRGPAVTG